MRCVVLGGGLGTRGQMVKETSIPGSRGLGGNKKDTDKCHRGQMGKEGGVARVSS